jgi:ABC-type transporter Mla MlaB component
MIRVTKTEELSRAVTIDGELSGDSIAVVETCCAQAGSNRKPVQLFLRDVTSMDQAGRMLLARLAAKGIHLVASGVYTSYLVDSLTSDMTTPEFVRGGEAKGH